MLFYPLIASLPFKKISAASVQRSLQCCSLQSWSCCCKPLFNLYIFCPKGCSYCLRYSAPNPGRNATQTWKQNGVPSANKKQRAFSGCGLFQNQACNRSQCPKL